MFIQWKTTDAKFLCIERLGICTGKESRVCSIHKSKEQNVLYRLIYIIKEIKMIDKVIEYRTGKLLTKKDNGNLFLYRFEECGRRKKSSINAKECQKEIDEYLPERKGSKYYWGITPKTNFKKVKEIANEYGLCLTTAKVPKEKVYVGNFDVVQNLCTRHFSKEKLRLAKKLGLPITKQEKIEAVKEYKILPYIELEKMKPTERLKNYKKRNLEFLVK